MRASRLRDTLLVAELGVCLLLLVTTGVLLRGLSRIAAIHPGYDPRGVYSLANYTPIDAARVAAGLEAESWIESVAHALDVSSVSVAAPGKDQFVPAMYSFVSSEYLPLFRIPIIRGRNFTRQESVSGAPVALVSRGTATLLWPGEDAIGKTLRLDPTRGGRREQDAIAGSSHVEVIGVADDVISGSLAQGVDRLRLYLPAPPGTTSNVFVRAKGAGPDRARLFQEAWTRMASPDQTATVFSMEQRLYWDTYPFRALAWASSLLGVVALLLTLSGSTEWCPIW